jgi:hypothetical protein
MALSMIVGRPTPSPTPIAILSDRLSPSSGFSMVSIFAPVVGVPPVAVVRVLMSVTMLKVVLVLVLELVLVLVLVLEIRREVVVDRLAHVSSSVQYVPS